MSDEFYIIFDSPPGPDAPRFVEVERIDGSGAANTGADWERHHGNFWRLGPFGRAPKLPELSDADLKLLSELPSSQAGFGTLGTSTLKAGGTIARKLKNDEFSGLVHEHEYGFKRTALGDEVVKAST